MKIFQVLHASPNAIQNYLTSQLDAIHLSSYWKFCGCKLIDGGVFSILVLLFKHNCVICRMIRDCTMGYEFMRSLALVLTEFESLKEFKLFFCSIKNGGVASEFIQSLDGHPGLSCLCFYGIETDIPKW